MGFSLQYLPNPSHLKSLPHPPPFKTRTFFTLSMPPKKKATSESSKSKKKSRVSEKEICSKAIHDRSFRSLDDSFNFMTYFSQWSIGFGKVVDFSFFDTYHMHLKSLFNHIGWDKFLSLDQPQYSTKVLLYSLHSPQFWHHYLLC